MANAPARMLSVVLRTRAYVVIRTGMVWRSNYFLRHAHRSMNPTTYPLGAPCMETLKYSDKMACC